MSTEDAREVFDRLHEKNSRSKASYAIRFTAGFEGMMMVLSSVSDLKQMADNISYMNAKEVFHNWNTDYYYNNVHTVQNGKASADP